MTGLGLRLILLFLLWMNLFQNGTCNSYADILWGQCYSFCLTRHQLRSQHQATKEDLRSPKVEVTIKECRRDKICKRCLYVCQRPKNTYLDHNSCLQDCENIRARGKKTKARRACTEACNFLNQSSSAKYGSCPVENYNQTGLHGTCAKQCRSDVECDRMDKCCSNGCGTTCHSPTQLDVFAPKPEALVFKVLRDGAVLVKWGKKPTGNFIKPVVYVFRWWCSYTRGVKFSATTRPRMKIKDLRPASSCNFMVASTNVHGSLGFSDPQSYKKKLLKPSSPMKIEVIKNRLNGDKVEVTIGWDPPNFLDGLPLVRYLILWADGLPEVSPELHRLRMNKKSVKAERTTVTIQGLKADTTYFVQVIAVVKWRGQNLNGKPKSIYIETKSKPQPPIPEPPVPEGTNGDTNIYNVTVQDAIFIRLQLTAKVMWSVRPNSHVSKYMLYWTPNVCDGEAQHRKAKQRSAMEATTHEQEFVLYKLKSNCLYELKLYTVSYFGEKESGYQHFFQTPPCHDTKGSKDVNCPPKVRPPLTPANMSIRFKPLASCSCQVVISWELPGTGAFPHQFSVSWGPSREPRDSRPGHIVYDSVPFRTHIPGNEKEACVTFLKPNTHYTVQVTSHANKLKSSPAIQHFVTPSNMAKCESPDLPDINEDSEEPVAEETEGIDKEAVKGLDDGASYKSCLMLSLLLPVAVLWWNAALN